MTAFPTGDWDLAKRILSQAPTKVRRAYLTTLRREAHALRGSARLVGADEMALACSALENVASEGSTADLAEAAGSIREAFYRVRPALESYRVRGVRSFRK